MKILPLILLLSVALGTYAQTGAPADETAVRELVAHFGSVFNAHDPKAFAATFAEDADFTNWVGMSAYDRADIEVFHVPVLTVMYKNGQQTISGTTV